MYTLMLVDDEPDVLEAIQKTVPWENYGILLTDICKNAAEALERMRADPPDLVVTDVKMPSIDGIEMIRRAKAAGVEAEFIVLSGFDEFEYAKSAMNLGVRYYLLKPCNEEELVDALLKAEEDRSRARQTRHIFETPKAEPHERQSDFVRIILDYMEEHLSDSSLTLRWVSNHLVFRNEDYVGKAFSAYTGKSFGTYLNEKRMERAKYLMRTLDGDRIYEIASAVGLGHDPRYFSKLFKKYTGLSPKAYRLLHKPPKP